MLASARSRHGEDTKWLRKFEAQWSRQDRPDALDLPGAESQRACTRASSRTSRRRQEERQAWGGSGRRWGASPSCVASIYSRLTTSATGAHVPLYLYSMHHDPTMHLLMLSR